MNLHDEMFWSNVDQLLFTGSSLTTGSCCPESPDQCEPTHPFRACSIYLHLTASVSLCVGGEAEDVRTRDYLAKQFFKEPLIVVLTHL